MTHPELSSEQSFIAHAEHRLDVIRAEAAAVGEEVVAGERGGQGQLRLERDLRVGYSLRRLQGLRLGDEPLVIGRIDSDDGGLIRVGRLAIDDADREPLIIDWRAPVAAPFYRATPLDRQGVIRRRHYQYRKRQLVDIDDEVLDVDAAESRDLVLVGEAVLLAALERARTGRMGDIVATIQREQDEIIRTRMGGVLVVE